MKQYNYPIELEGGLLLRCAQTDDDIERLALFNNQIHSGEDLKTMVRNLAAVHPLCKPECWLFIENPRDKTIISSLALIPWCINLGGAQLKAAELGFVGTLPDYRFRGLARRLTNHFHEIVETGNFVFSFLQGIPYYYRQYGYEYAMPLDVHVNLKLKAVPSLKEKGREAYRVVECQNKDIKRLMELYGDYCSGLDISTHRSLGVWKYLFGPAQKTEMVHDQFVVIDKSGAIDAYFRIARHGFGEGLILDEASRVSPRVALTIVRFLKKMAQERKKPSIRFNLSPGHPLLLYARSLGAQQQRIYAWQVRFGNAGRFFKAIRSVLEKRVAESDLSGLTGKVTVNLYKEAWALCFRNGALVKIEPLGLIGETGLMLPPFAASQLFLGHRSLMELKSIYPDVWIEGDEWQALDVLFPTLNSFLHTNY